VDRERFDKACWLLERNVDCLCSVRGINIEVGDGGDSGGQTQKVKPLHILKKINEILVQILHPQRASQKHKEALRRRATLIKRRETSAEFQQSIYR